eukprot:scaffold209067_cov52-Prasinocladus_malaysianus.AAC.2
MSCGQHQPGTLASGSDSDDKDFTDRSVRTRRTRASTRPEGSAKLVHCNSAAGQSEKAEMSEIGEQVKTSSNSDPDSSEISDDAADLKGAISRETKRKATARPVRAAAAVAAEKIGQAAPIVPERRSSRQSRTKFTSLDESALVKTMIKLSAGCVKYLRILQEAEVALPKRPKQVLKAAGKKSKRSTNSEVRIALCCQFRQSAWHLDMTWAGRSLRASQSQSGRQ